MKRRDTKHEPAPPAPKRFDWNARPEHCPECGERLTRSVHLCYGGIGEDVPEAFIDPDIGDKMIRDLRESVMGSAADQKRKAGCEHRWVKLRGKLFGYMIVRARCAACGTYREARR